MKVDIQQLTEKEKDQLFKKLAKEKADKAQAQSEQRKAYKAKVDAKIPKVFKALVAFSDHASKVKTKVYKEFQSLVVEKSLVYGEEVNEQQSHTFTSSDGSQSITIGYRVNDGWDDTVNVGIEKVKEFIQSLSKDKNSKALVETVLQLLSTNSKGHLKASRVLQLQKLAEEVKDAGFSDAIEIIRQAYRPIPSRQFVTVRYKNAEGVVVDLPLAISEAPLLESLEAEK